MSHFTVMVFGDNPEELLAPYDEGIEIDEHAVSQVSQKDLDSFCNHYIKENPADENLSMDELYELYGDDWNNSSWHKLDGVWTEFSTYNPKSKWDWYQTGGRWAGYFKLKEGATGNIGVLDEDDNESHGGYADVLLKKDIDIEFMRKEAEKRAAIEYDKARELIIEYGEGFISWDKIKETQSDIDKCRSLYLGQPLVKAFNEHSDLFGYAYDINSYTIPRETYLETARNSAICPFAFVTPQGKWIEKGEMGWWACISNEKDQNKWNRIFTEFFDALPENTRITLVDCHI